jgi:hypothetical protein
MKCDYNTVGALLPKPTPHPDHILTLASQIAWGAVSYSTLNFRSTLLNFYNPILNLKVSLYILTCKLRSLLLF